MVITEYEELVLANYNTFVALLIIAPMLFAPLWVLGPVTLVIALVVEVFIYWLFITKLLKFKVLS